MSKKATRIYNINPFMTGQTSVSGCRFEHVDNIFNITYKFLDEMYPVICHEKDCRNVFIKIIRQ